MREARLPNVLECEEPLRNAVEQTKSTWGATHPDGPEMGVTPYMVLMRSLRSADRSTAINCHVSFRYTDAVLRLIQECAGFHMGFPWDFLRKNTWDSVRTFMGGRGH